jgi:hypothetical protein
MGWFSAAIGQRTLRSWAIVGIVGTIAMTTVLLVGMQTAFAHADASLPGSNFEIDTDANLKVDHPEDLDAEDWASIAQGTSADGQEVRQADKPTGATDDSFGQGTKEDTAVPTVVNGSIPPNKSDLLNFGVYLETNDSGGRFLHMFWHRVQEPQGTTNMDFEFNTSTATSANGATPVRTAGDVLIQYDLSQGGTNPVLFVSRWVTTGNSSQCQAANSTPCWGKKTNLTAAGDATGSINTSAIPAAESDGLGDISPRTFGEATVDFNALTGTNPCVGFGSAYLKSRASDSFTAALKDFIAPTSLNINRCGAIQVHKDRKHAAAGPGDHPHAGVSFTVNGVTKQTNANGNACFDSLPFGEYTVHETTLAGYNGEGDKSVTVDNAASCNGNSGTTSTAGEQVTFHNTPLTDLSVSVNSQVDGGTASTIDCKDAASGTVASGSTGANGDGSASASDLEPGTYTCTIVVDP